MYQLNDISTASYSAAADNLQQSSEAPALFYPYKNSLWNLTKQEGGERGTFLPRAHSAIITIELQTQAVPPHEATT